MRLFDCVPIRTGRRKKVLRIPDYSLKKFLGIPEGKVLVIEPALIHESTKRVVNDQGEQEGKV